MTGLPTEAVIAGSKSFALALLAPLTERVGTRPRIAADLSQVLKLTGGAGLVVVEFQGDRSLDAIRQLLDESAGLSVIVAIPDGNPAAEVALRSLGVESARWDGKPDDVLSAVARRVAGAPVAGAKALRPAAAPEPVPTRARTASAVQGLFDDLPLEAPGAPAAPGDVTAPLVPRGSNGPAQAGNWPSNVPGAAEASHVLAQGLRGVFAPAGSPLAVVAETMAGMSPLEKAVLLGQPQPIDLEPVRRAAVMRVRVAVALATAPAGAGAAPVDAAAVSALLGEIDGLLSQVNALVAGAPAELQPSLEVVRNALVKEAIAFSEAAHRGDSVQGGPDTVRPGITTAAERKAGKTRVLAIASKQEQDIAAAEAKQRRLLLGVLAVAVLGAGTYHLYEFLQRRGAVEPVAPHVTGAPPRAHVAGSAGPGDGRGPTPIVSPGGTPFTPEELRNLEDQQSLLGNVVQQLEPGVVVVLPGKPSGAAPAPAR